MLLRIKPLESLPHRFPFLMLDRITSCGDGKATGIKLITGDFFSRHHSFSHVLIIEALAQISGIASGIKDRGMLVEIKDMIFHKTVLNGDVLQLESSLNRKFGGMFDFSVSAFIDGNRAVEGTVYLSIHG